MKHYGRKYISVYILEFLKEGCKHADIDLHWYITYQNEPCFPLVDYIMSS